MSERARAERSRGAGRRTRTERSSFPPVWWIVGTAVIVLLGLLYFGVIGPYDQRASDPGRTGSTAERPADPRITLLAGQRAPDFSLPATDGRSVRLSELQANGNVLLYFQEGAMCPPCWQQMRDLKRDGEKLRALNVQLVTITVDPLSVLTQTASREQVSDMILLSDAGLAVSKTYQMLYTGMMNGATPGHSFVLIDRQGKILWRRDFREMYVPDPMILDPVAKALGK
ncbi:MAG: peroxiredoxin family protein [Candidatus Limnocylindria bacterium]